MLESIPFKEKGLWGIMNKKNGNATVNPKYEKVVNSYYDSVFIVLDSEKNYGAINPSGEILIEFGKDWIFFNEADTANYFSSLMTAPVYLNGKVNYREYFITKNRQCISVRYFPCPFGVEIANDTLSESLQFIQKAERNFYENNVDSAVDNLKKAINYSLKDPFLYYWASESLLMNKQYEIDYNSSSVKKYFDWIKSNLDKALELENNIHYRIRIKRLQLLFYQEVKRDSEKAKSLETEIKNLKNEIKHEIRASYWWNNY